MIKPTASEFLAAPHKRILFVGMSGLGKTYLTNVLINAGDWAHYSIDHRIGAVHLKDDINSNLKALGEENTRNAAKYITKDNLAPVSYFMGKPGDASRGGIPIAEYKRRQAAFKAAEVKALLETPEEIVHAKHPNFVCDTGGSFCEWVDPEDAGDPILSALSQVALIVWIKGTQAHTQKLIKRFEAAPKPMAYRPDFLANAWDSYLAEHDVRPETVEPDAFMRYSYARALAHRQPIYEAIAARWGVTIEADDLANVSEPQAILDCIARGLDS